ncbi:MAG TPA: hypothetical protein DIS87_04440, partial [Armatimonadetes bacterium]|nr:hypothetical protein [Armatimonadota bacterium]
VCAVLKYFSWAGARPPRGIPPLSLTRILKRVEESQGLILVTGPTGSGKSTTLYSILNHLNDNSRNIVTIEDP